MLIYWRVFQDLRVKLPNGVEAAVRSYGAGMKFPKNAEPVGIESPTW